ncbi:DUF6476 family protein [Swingsia samuiensis]|uniref:Uncharacterized protein n=1 Tax=Swingsia samuiensis TaxID=1293412 RepID=A0A4Y6UL56_9PROT|nr:DUF6476 family protein [Swingsia samuiensis]QDH17368.1 hypothetical protein E3D00_07190 [Swingsia samuiensis]
MNQRLVEEQGVSEPTTSKALMAAVIIMGVLIIMGVVGIIGVIVHRVMHPKHASQQIATEHGSFSRLALPLARGEHILSVTSRNDGLMAVTLVQSGSERILLWSPEEGRIVSELDFGTESSIAP